MSESQPEQLAEEYKQTLWVATDVDRMDHSLRVTGRISRFGEYDFAVTVSPDRVGDVLAAAGAQPLESPVDALRRVGTLLLAVGPDAWLSRAGIEHSLQAHGPGSGPEERFWDLPSTDPAAVLVRTERHTGQTLVTVASAPGESERQFWMLTGDVWTPSSWQEMSVVLHDASRRDYVWIVDPRELALHRWTPSEAQDSLPEPMVLPFGPRASYAKERARRKAEAASPSRKKNLGSITVFDGGALQVRAVGAEDGGLTIAGQDLSADEEYEYKVSITPADVAGLASALGVEVGSALMVELLQRGKEMVRTGERTWLARLGVSSTLWTWGVPPPLQPRVPRLRENYLVHWDADGGVVTGAYAQITWGPKGEPLFGRYYRWHAGQWSACSAGSALKGRPDDCVDVVARERLDGWGVGAAAHIPLPAADASDLSRLAEAVATWAHRGQVDESGIECIVRSRAVASAFDPVTDSLAHCAAWLHDVLAETSTSADDLLVAGIPSAVVDVLQSLARPAEVPSGVFDSSARTRLVARAVERAVRLNTADPGRLADPASAEADSPTPESTQTVPELVVPGGPEALGVTDEERQEVARYLGRSVDAVSDSDVLMVRAIG